MDNDIVDYATGGRLGKNKSGGKWKDTFSTIAIIIMAPILALFLTNFVFQSYQVDGPSMETTLQNSDRLIVTKTGKTWARLTNKPYQPKRYEIVIFNFSGEAAAGQTDQKQLIKRVIGLPGDRVVVDAGVVTVFNKEQPAGFLVDTLGPEKNVIGSTSNNNNVTVKPGEVFVMGDNRENSLDSRAFGPISSTDLVGKLNYRIFPFDKFQKF